MANSNSSFDPSVSPTIKWDMHAWEAWADSMRIHLRVRPMESPWERKWQWQATLNNIGIWGSMCDSSEKAKKMAERASRLLKQEFS